MFNDMDKTINTFFNAADSFIAKRKVPDTKRIDCPEHPTQHKATLFCFPHRYAGTWECPEGYTDAHEHVNLESETTAYNFMNNGEPDQREDIITVCSDCRVAVEE